MNCEQTRNELLALRELAPLTQDHLKGCEECASLALALSGVEAGFSAMRNLEPPRSMSVAIRRRIAAEQGRTRRDLMVALDTIATAGIAISTAVAAYRFYPEPIVIAVAITLISTGALLTRWETTSD